MIRTIYNIAYIVTIIGGVNWGLFGLFHVDLVALIFGYKTLASRAVYVLVGVSSLYLLFNRLELITMDLLEDPKP